MLLPINWLKDYIKINLSPEKLAELLMFKSFEVEEVNGDVLDLSITPDRNDCFSILGLAREVSALTGNMVKFPKIDVEESKKFASSEVKVEIQNSELCPQYLAAVIKNVKVGESPAWLKEKLESMGVRSINNVVDITNFVLFEMGQPLHAFDTDKLSGKKLVIRNAKKGEKILALDEQTYNLEKDMLVIVDDKKPVAIAGIMGGAETLVNRRTKNIILESAIFNPKSVRLTSKKLGLRSESSTRFERGFDPTLTEQAINRAAALVQELCGGEVLKGNVAPLKIKSEKKTIKLELDYLNKLLGVEIKPQEVKKILVSLGFEVSSSWDVAIPSWRQNMNCVADLIEEVARVYGYEKLPDKFLNGELVPLEEDKKLKWEGKIKNLMQVVGFDEVYNYSFYGEKQMKPMGLEETKHLEVENPINPDQRFMRTTLLPRLLGVASRNARKFDEVKIFEVGKVYNPEELRLAGVIVSKSDDVGLYREISGIVSYVLDKMNLSEKKSSWILKLNLLNPKEKEEWKIKDSVAYFEIDLEKIISNAKESKKFESLPLYPSVSRDLSIVVPQDVLWKDVDEIVQKFGGEFLKDIEFFDLYKGKGIEGDKKSFAFHLEFSSSERTLESNEVDEVMGEIARALEKKLKANLRI
ncbi:MAG: phenylalanine--tRNA ligase subunit beta [Patescibacteria group bacterium]|nr:phenylalanine--tRNA ligase subunit beta [Patescibacteria group bacterium]